MDYTEISNSIRMMIKAQGVDDKYLIKRKLYTMMNQVT